jgi:hypothetical protein
MADSLFGFAFGGQIQSHCGLDCLGNHNPYIEEEQTTQWPKEKGLMNKLGSKKHYTYN